MSANKLHLKILALLSLLVFVGSACNTLDDNQKHQLQVANDDLVNRTNQLDQELKTRQRFFEGVSGIFEGTAPWSVPGTPVKSLATRITISPTVPAYGGDRQRTYEELNADLVALALNVQVDETLDTGGQAGCIFNNVQPDMVTGEIHLVASTSTCPISYTLWIVPQGTDSSQENTAQLSQDSGIVAQSLLAGSTGSADSFHVTMDSTQAAQISNFSVTRTETP